MKRRIIIITSLLLVTLLLIGYIKTRDQVLDEAYSLVDGYDAYPDTSLVDLMGPIENPRILVETENYALAKYEPREGAYLGAYIIQDTLIDGDMAVFNEMTQKKHASFFRYVGYGSPYPQEWFDDLEKVGAAAHLAWEPNEGLDKVEDDTYLRSFARKLKDSGMPVFLRFASEMNGTWTAYSGDSAAYIEKWRLVHDVMAEEALNVMMVWTVFTFPQATILEFYPGDEYVDWVGVNIYNVVYHNNDLNDPGDHEDPLELLDYVYDSFSERKPIQISEFGATHYTVTDDEMHIDFAKEKITRMYDGLREKYPRVKSIFYFNVNNLINAPEGRKINNYALTDNQDILNTYNALIEDPHYLSDIKENESGQKNKEFHNIKDDILTRNASIYISSEAVRQQFVGQVILQPDTNKLRILQGSKDFEMEITSTPQTDKAFMEGGISYLPLKSLARQLGYKIFWDRSEQLIRVVK